MKFTKSVIAFFSTEIIKDLFLYFSAFVPMYFLICLHLSLDLIFVNIVTNWFIILELVFLIVLMVFGLIGLLVNTVFCTGKVVNLVVKNAKNITDQHFLGYFSIFILFALSFDFSHASMFCVFIGISIFVGIVYIKNKLFYINPLLNIIGFSFYSVTYKCENKVEELKVFYKGETIKSGDNLTIQISNDKFGLVVRDK